MAEFSEPCVVYNENIVDIVATRAWRMLHLMLLVADEDVQEISKLRQSPISSHHRHHRLPVLGLLIPRSLPATPPHINHPTRRVAVNILTRANVPPRSALIMMAASRSQEGPM